MDYNPPNNFGAILLATFRQGVQNHQTGITAIAPLYVNICPPIISVEKKQSQREKYQLKSFTFSFLLFYMKEKRTLFSVMVMVMVMVMVKLRSWSQITLRKVQKSKEEIAVNA